MTHITIIVLTLVLSSFGPQHQFVNGANQGSPSQKESLPQHTEKIYSMDEVDKVADVRNINTVLEQLESRMHCKGTGTTTISVVLRKTGKVTDAKIETTTGCKVSAKAIAVLRKIKFTPASKNGRAVSQLFEVDIKKELHAIPNPEGAPSP